MDNSDFSTIEEAKSKVTKYFKDNNNPICLDSRTTDAQYNNKTKDDSCKITDLPQSVICALRWLSGGKRGDYQNCSVLYCHYCVLKVVHSHDGDDDGLSRRHDGSQVTDNEFGDVSEDQSLRRRYDHMCHM